MKKGFEEGTKENHTHIEFTYFKGDTTVMSKELQEIIFPREFDFAESFEYLIKITN